MEPDSQSKDGDSKTYKRIFSDNSLSGKLQKRLASGQRNYSCPPFSNMISLYRKCFFEIGSDPALKERIGIVIELKYAADSNLEAACREALNQIEEKKICRRTKAPKYEKDYEIWDCLLQERMQSRACIKRRLFFSFIFSHSVVI